MESGLWVLAEYENNKVKLNLNPKEFRPVEDYLGCQKRFAHLQPAEWATIGKNRDEEWAEIRRKWA